MTEAQPNASEGMGVSSDRLLPTLVGLGVALAGPMLVGEFVLYPLISTVGGVAALPLWIGPHWLSLGVLLGVVVFWERESLTSIGLIWTGWREVGWGVFGFAAGLVVFVATTPLLAALGLQNPSSGQALLSEPLPTVVAVAITAGIVEEILFRGYPIERLVALTGNIWFAAAVPLVVFTLIHVPLWGVGTTIQIGLWSVVVTVLYVWRRSLVAPVVMHLLNDIVGFVVLPALS